MQSMIEMHKSGMSVQEIADKLELPPGLVAQWLSEEPWHIKDMRADNPMQMTLCGRCGEPHKGRCIRSL